MLVESCLLHLPVASIPLIEMEQRLAKLFLVEVGPIHGGEVVFGVSALPDQEIAGAKLTASADYQVRVGKLTRVQRFADQFFGDLFRRVAFCNDLLDGMHDLCAA